MKVWTAALAGEVNGWPQVGTRVFFGFTALYLKDKIFALLPRTRGMEAANSLAFKLEVGASTVLTRLEQDRRIRIWSSSRQKARWFAFELSSDADLHDALDWLGRAYEAADKSKKSH
jgi:hypothetical protein